MKKLSVLCLALIMSICFFAVPAFAAGNFKLLFDFESDQIFIRPECPDVVPTHTTKGALLGKGSLKVDITEYKENGIWNYMFYAPEDYLPDGTGYDGYMFRMKTAVEDNGIFKLMADGDYGRAEFGNNIVLVDMSGKDVTPSNASAKAGAWNGFVLPADFDGYVFIPFSGNMVGSTFDPAKTTALIIGFAEGQWLNSTLYIDNFGYYKGNDYKALIAEQGPAQNTQTSQSTQQTNQSTGSTQNNTTNPKTGDFATIAYGFTAGVALLSGIFVHRRKK